MPTSATMWRLILYIFYILKSFSIELMKDVVIFCEKTLTETTNKKIKLDTSLKKGTDSQEYKEIKHTINKSIETTRNICRKRKAKKFSNLKSGKPTRQPIA